MCIEQQNVTISRTIYIDILLNVDNHLVRIFYHFKLTISTQRSAIIHSGKLNRYKSREVGL